MVRLPLATLMLLVLAQPVVASAPAQADGKACSAGHVALTFDDGPSSTVTPRLVTSLQELHVPATFFMVGERVVASPDTARKVESSGFLVGNHSYRHQDLTRLTTDEIVATVRNTDSALRDAGVHPTRLMRPPYGAVNQRVYDAIRRTHLRPVLWTVDPRDWESGNAAQIAARVLGQLHPGNEIVLQHDGVANSPSSVAAVPRIVREARRRGFCFVALDEHGRPGFPTPHARVTADRAVTEGDRLRVTVTLDAMAGRDTSARVSVKGARKDVGRFDPLVRIPAGSLTGAVEIPVLADGVYEPKEKARISLASGAGVRLAGGPVSVRIKDADGPPSVSGRPAAVAEPLVGSVPVPVTFTLDRASSKPVSLTVQTVPGTADATDFTPVTTTVTIPPGGTSATVSVEVLADGVPEGPETFAVRVIGASGAAVAVADAVVTINPPGP